MQRRSGSGNGNVRACKRHCRRRRLATIVITATRIEHPYESFPPTKTPFDQSTNCDDNRGYFIAMLLLLNHRMRILSSTACDVSCTCLVVAIPQVRSRAEQLQRCRTGGFGVSKYPNNEAVSADAY